MTRFAFLPGLHFFLVPAATILLLLGLGSCHKEEPLPGFDMIYQQDFTIPAGIGSNAEHIFTFKNIPTHYEQYLTQYNKADSAILQVITAQAVLSGTFGDANFDFVDKAVLRIYNENDPNDFVEIAYRFPVPLSPGNSLPLIPNLPDIKRFMSASRFNIKLILTLRNITQEETDTRIDLKLKANY